MPAGVLASCFGLGSAKPLRRQPRHPVQEAHKITLQATCERIVDRSTVWPPSPVLLKGSAYRLKHAVHIIFVARDTVGFRPALLLTYAWVP